MNRLCAIFSQSSDPGVRQAAFAAVLRHAHVSPKSAVANIYPKFLHCLKQINSVSVNLLDTLSY